MNTRDVARGGIAADRDREAVRAETSAYIADMARELSVVARRADLDVLAYLIDMVEIEAASRPELADTDG